LLFNSLGFLFIFLPVVLLGYQLAGLLGRRAVIAWLAFMSLVFYAEWRRAFLILLVGSILFNYACSRIIASLRDTDRTKSYVLFAGVTGNLLLLGYYKYLFPFLNALGRLEILHFQFAGVLLPLGISFFTFTQIGYLIDLRQGAAEPQEFVDYVLFVTFFPHLIAGPLLHHSEIMPQFQQDRTYRLRRDDLAVGFTWFVMGLFKKVYIADTIAPFADTAFAHPGALTAIGAWSGVLAYTAQLYFDFSGYSDMAIGLARMLSIRFPLNFDSPYKAANIIDFWARWHMTLTRYVTLYLYNPISLWVNRRRIARGKKVSRKGSATIEGFVSMVAFPTLVSMFIIGVWHGAGFQFLLFGVFHGVYLTVNHGWRIWRGRNRKHGEPVIERTGPSAWLVHAGCVLLTLLCVVIGQVLFRANSTAGAFQMMASMAARHGVGLNGEGYAKIFIRLAALFAIIWLMPNTQQVLAHFNPADGVTGLDSWLGRKLQWRPSAGWAIAIGAAFLLALVYMEDTSRFLYFQF
jgi:D-alanyl-lipoteichoic acid acyltransferase DltB (MBOAT superfamily)